MKQAIPPIGPHDLQIEVLAFNPDVKCEQLDEIKHTHYFSVANVLIFQEQFIHAGSLPDSLPEEMLDQLAQQQAITVRVDGERDKRRRVWIRGKVIGIEVLGYTPDDNDMEAAERIVETRDMQQLLSQGLTGVEAQRVLTQRKEGAEVDAPKAGPKLR